MELDVISYTEEAEEAQDKYVHIAFTNNNKTILTGTIDEGSGSPRLDISMYVGLEGCSSIES